MSVVALKTAKRLAFNKETSHGGSYLSDTAILKQMSSSLRLDGRHVVFGSVKEGMDVVKKVESYGSRSGRPSKRITITDCGELQ